ncbi:MAG: hypothetical protein NZ561_02670 [Phycisphaerae bacterium]|nr:hypothetical protein [Phycisphaerae bacterium]MDW8262166.1 lipopolysaccharide kinase InaA family protein [Phycisphaerales bacterium]
MFRIEPQFVELFRHIGLNDACSAFEHPCIRVWRSIRERENATIDARHPDGRPVRLHLKRDRTPQADASAGAEASNLLALAARGIPTAPLAAYGWLADNRSVVITEDLVGYVPADRLIRDGTPFASLIEPTSRLVARLHGAGAYHRDLYLCHLMVRPDDRDVRLIDCARVLFDPWFRRRWQRKDLAQFVHSARELGVSPEQINQWLDSYGRFRGRMLSGWQRFGIDRKARWIARHDQRLRKRQPHRNISIPDAA